MQNFSTKSLKLCYLGKQNTGSWAENTTILNRLLNCNSDETRGCTQCHLYSENSNIQGIFNI